jgi:hypothetical protein
MRAHIQEQMAPVRAELEALNAEMQRQRAEAMYANLVQERDQLNGLLKQAEDAWNALSPRLAAYSVLTGSKPDWLTRARQEFAPVFLWRGDGTLRMPEVGHKRPF